jgi:indolepyruvate ferredoxin oxidoreductase alpha subunit
MNHVGDGKAATGMIASGAGYNYAVDAARILDVDAPILKLGTTNPLPRKVISEFIRGLKSVLVVEELSPYLELRVKALAKDVNPRLDVLGKGTGHLSEAMEYSPDIVTAALSDATGIPAPVDYAAVKKNAERLKDGLPDRFPTFCPGCPHRASIHALRSALKGTKHVLATDIGCYSPCRAW